MWYKTTRIKNNKKQFESFRSNTYSTIFFIFLTFILTIAFYYINPNLNKVAIQIFGKDKVFEYGSNFKYFEIASIINSLITALSIVALTMMVLGFRESWTIWIIKNVFSFIFFGGIGFLNITTLLINVTYMCISIYLYLVTTNKQKLRIAFSNKINFENTLKFLKAKEFYLSLSQQSALNNFDFKTENKILKSLLKEIKKSQFEDNVIFDNYLLDHILALKKYQLSSVIKKIKRDYLVFKYKISLALQNKLNYIFIYTESNNFEAYKNKKNWKKFTKKVVFLSTNKEKSLNEIKNIIKVELNKKTTSNFEKIFKRLFA
ncbi:nicotinamide mononucleotide transporter family protein [Mycoplasmopsis cynos]|nr:nicotinamide mononucleotide transporter family protein [Mycoplasmopsis cynos]